MQRFLSVALWNVAVLWICPSLLFAQASEESDPNSQLRLMREDLHHFENTLDAQLEDASHRMLRKSSSQSKRQAVAAWRSKFAGYIGETLDQANPMEGLLEAWAYAMGMRTCLLTGAGASLFGDAQQDAVDVAKSADELLEHMAERYVPRKDFKSIKAGILKNVAKRPMQANFEVPEDNLFYDLNKASNSLFDSVLKVPMTPFRTAQKVDATASSMRNFDATASRFADIVEDLPQEARWQAEMLLLEMEGNDLITSSVASAVLLSRAAERLSITADRLPQMVEEASKAAFREITDAQPELRQTIEDTQKLVESLNELSGNIQELAEIADRSIRETAETGGQ